MDTQQVLKELDRCYAEGDRNKTERFLVQSIRQCRAEGDWQTRLTLSNELIGLYRVLGRFDDGEEVFLACLRLLQDNDLEGTIPFASTLLNGATMYRAAGRPAQAEGLFHQVYGIYRVLMDPDDFRFSGFYNNLSLVQREQGKYQEALVSMEKSLSILEKLSDTEPEQATCHANIADVLISLDRLEEAEEHLSLSDRIFASLPKADPHYASCLNIRACLCEKRGELQAAISYYEKGMAWMERFFGRNRSYEIMKTNRDRVFKQMEVPNAGT